MNYILLTLEYIYLIYNTINRSPLTPKCDPG